MKSYIDEKAGSYSLGMKKRLAIVYLLSESDKAYLLKDGLLFIILHIGFTYSSSLLLECFSQPFSGLEALD